MPRTIDRPADVGQAYFIAPYQFERKLITNSVRFAARNNPAPVTVEAPLCVQAAFYTQNGGKRTVVHLLNEVNTSANRALPENNPSQREEIIPVSGIRVTLAADATSAYLEPEHKALEMKKGPEGVTVTVPSLNVHSMVVFE